MATQSVKDILNTSLPNPIKSFRPSLAAGGSASFNFSRPRKSYRFDPRTQLYNRVKEDEIAVGGYDVGATIQTVSSTVLNEGPHNPGGGWSTANASRNAAFNLFANPNKVFSQTYHDTASRLISDAGTEDAGVKTLYCIAEQRTSNKTGVGVKIDRSNFANCTIGRYDWANDNTGTVRADGGTINWVYANRLTEDGPNGNPVVEIWMQYDPDSTYEGNDREVLFIPTLNGSSQQATILHYCGLYDHASAGPPIKNGSGTSTRNGDYLATTIDAGSSFHVTIDLEVIGHANRNTIDRLALPNDGQFGFYQGEFYFQHGGSNESVGSINTRERTLVSLGRSRSTTRISQGTSVSDTDSQNFGGNTTLKFGGSRTVKIYEINVYPRILTADEIKTLAA
jgi:hypothetical protein